MSEMATKIDYIFSIAIPSIHLLIDSSLIVMHMIVKHLFASMNFNKK